MIASHIHEKEAAEKEQSAYPKEHGPLTNGVHATAFVVELGEIVGVEHHEGHNKVSSNSRKGEDAILLPVPLAGCQERHAKEDDPTPGDGFVEYI